MKNLSLKEFQALFPSLLGFVEKLVADTTKAEKQHLQDEATIKNLEVKVVDLENKIKIKDGIIDKFREIMKGL